MEDRSPRSPLLQRALHVAVVAAMWVLVIAGSAAFAFFFIMTPTRWFYVNTHNFIAWRNGLVLQYTYVNATTGKATPLLSSAVSFILIWQWCATLAAALGAAGLLWAHSPHGNNNSNNGIRAFKPTPPTDVTATATAARGKAARHSTRTLARCLAKSAARLRRLLRWQVPPRGVWRSLLGPDGLSLLDLILILTWFGLHAMWLTDMTLKVLDTRRAPVAVKVVATKSNTTSALNTSNSSYRAPPPAINGSAATRVNATQAAHLRHLLATNGSSSTTGNSSSIAKSGSNSTSVSKAKTMTATAVKPLPREVQGSLAKYTGFVGNLDLLLLFFPLPRCNFLHWLLQSDFPAMIKYHRWLGHGTLLMYSLHGCMYMALWKADGTFGSNMVWSMGGYVNNVAGLISLVAGWVLWVTSAPAIRRRFFNLFYSCHIAGTVLFMLFAFMHRKDIMNWVLPGVFLYLLDCVLRTLQQAFNWTHVTAAASTGPGSAAVAALSPHNSVLTLTLQCDPRHLSWAGLDIVFLNAPALSWWQWHPFTLANSSAAGDTKMVLHIKTYSHWTQRLVSRLATGATPLKLYVSGPYHGAHRKWITNFDRHVFVAGGIGVTPPLGMLQDLLSVRKSVAAATGSPPPGRVSLIWISRTRDELATLPDELLGEAARTGPDAWLDLQLYLTGDQQEGEQQDGEIGTQPDLGRSSNSKSSSTGVTIPVTSLTTTDSTTTIAATAAADGKASRPLSHDYMFSPLLWAACLVLCFGGGFAGFICAQSYEAHISRTVAVRTDYTHVGMLQFAALGLGAVLPPGLVMMAVHLARALQDRRAVAATVAATSPSEQKELSLPNKDSCTALAACRLGSALHARLSVASTATFLSDDTLTSLEQHQFPSSPDCAKTPSTTTTTTASPSKAVADNGCHPPAVSAEPFIRKGRPDLAALLEQVALTGGGPAPPPQQSRISVELQQQEVGAAASPSVADTANGTAAFHPATVSAQDADLDVDLLDPSTLRVAVFVSGPVRLVGAVEELCAALNGPWGRPGRAYLEAHPLTHEL